jgi:hypothetical protein
MLATSSRFSRALISDGELIRASAARQLACSSIFAAVAALVIFTALVHHPVHFQGSAQPVAGVRHEAPIMTTAVMRVPSVMLATAQ